MISVKKVLLTGVAAASLAACNDGESSNPATAGRNELNPPGNLVTVTKPAAEGIDLYWTNANAEENFKGYYVFGAKAKLASLPAVAYPAGVAVAKGGQFPRCKDNTAFFQAFGFPVSEADCEGADEPAGGTGGGTAGSTLAQADGGGEEPVEKLTNFIPCSGAAAGASRSVAVAPKQLGTQKCTVTQAWDGTKLAPLVNGETYVFFVVAVAEDDNSVVSWSSNFVEDAPSATAFSGTIDLEAAQYVTLNFDATTFDKVTVATAKACTEFGAVGATTQSDGPCAVTGNNAAAANGIFIARDARSSGNPQRVFVSTSSNAANQFEIELVTNSANARNPGDEPATHTYSSKGTKVQVLENAVFDLKWTVGGAVRYGKVAFGGVTYAGDKSSKATLNVTVVLQPGAGVPHYLQ